MNILTFFGLKDLLCVKTKRREFVNSRSIVRSHANEFNFISFLII